MIPCCRLDQLELYKPQNNLSEISRRWNCSPLTAAIALSRGSDLEDLKSPSLRDCLMGLDLGSACGAMVEYWKHAVPGKRVLVYGDYDADGVSSTTLALKLCQSSGAENTSYYIPHRSKEGYGLHCGAADSIAKAGFDTLIITDCGTKDWEAVALARQQGLTVLVFDHHLTEGQLAEPHAIINPQIDGDEQGKTLCATAVLWCWAVKSGLFNLAMLDQYCQLAALATVSDCMPLEDLNRAIIRRGLEMTRYQPLPGLAALYTSFELPAKGISEEDWAMKVVPCLNAPGRLALADIAVEVLCASGDLAANVATLVEINRRRRDIASQISTALIRQIDRGNAHQVFFDDRWPVGLLSAIASRLCSQRGQGFALASMSGSSIRGTLRVPEGANAVGILKELDPLLERWGGHPFAAGFEVAQNNWKELSLKLDKMLRDIQPTESLEQAIEFEPTKVTIKDLDDLNKIGPFGKGNPAPLLFTPATGRPLTQPLGKTGRHLKILHQGAELIAFDGVKNIETLDRLAGWLYRPKLNLWRGVPRAQFLVEKAVVN